MHLQAPHCPSCGAPLDVPEGVTRVTCPYCSCTLVVDHERISTRRGPRAPEPEDTHPPYPEPEATSWAHATTRFELSVIEQRVPEAKGEVFAGVPLEGERFALVSLRIIDKEGAGVAWPLEAAFTALKTSLENDGDPGLAGNLALEALCQKPFEHRLEAAVLLFEPRHMRVTPWAAGWAEGLVWASSEEGRAVKVGPHHGPLERKSLRERGSHFENGAPVFLAHDDVVVMASAGLVGRGGRGAGDGARVLYEVLNAHLGEAPLRVVTLVKNGFWPPFQRHVSSRPAPTGDVRVAAVRAVPRPLAERLPPSLTVETHRSRRYELSLLKQPGDLTRVLPLHDDRAVLVWLSGPALPAAALDTACAAVTAVLDRRQHGDNENPRQAGREALKALGTEDVQLAVIQLFDRHLRVKYFRHGWKQPVALGPRGWRGDSMQQFDGGGEATVAQGHRLFFPGAASYEGEHGLLEDLARVWPGGRASRLYEALLNHWKTRKTPVALEAVARAVCSDEPDAPLGGLALVTGLQDD
jgi:hypothetical protein